MGGDHGPSVVVPAVSRAAQALPGEIRFLLHGDEPTLTQLLARYESSRSRIEIRHTDKVVAMDEKPAQALRRGKGTSMWKARRRRPYHRATPELSGPYRG